MREVVTESIKVIVQRIPFLKLYTPATSFAGGIISERIKDLILFTCTGIVYRYDITVIYVPLVKIRLS